MGWLDLLLGKKAAKQTRTVNKLVKAATKSPASKPAPARKVEWTKSEKGNDTAQIDDFQVTIFKQDGQWNFCVAEILDDDDRAEGHQDEPHFGDGYPTKTEAKKEALEYLS